MLRYRANARPALLFEVTPSGDLDARLCVYNMYIEFHRLDNARWDDETVGVGGADRVINCGSFCSAFKGAARRFK